MLYVAANSLAEEGLHVLLGVPNRDMLHFVSEATVKGVEVLLVDINEPENILRLMSRSRDIIDHLARPLAGVVMQYPGTRLISSNSAPDQLTFKQTARYTQRTRTARSLQWSKRSTSDG